MKYKGVRTQLCRCRTQPNYINEAYVPLGHATFLCPGTQRTQRKIRRLGRQRLLSMKSDFSVLYLLYVLLGTLTNTLRCPGATETQGNASERRTRRWLCCVWRKRGVSQATLVSETKEARDMDPKFWLAKVALTYYMYRVQKLLEISITSALMPTASKKH